MGLTLDEHHEADVLNLSHKEAYLRIREYYINFMKRWNTISETDKGNYIFGNGRKSKVGYIDKSSTYISGLPINPSLDDSIDLAKNVICKSLEYSYHDKDRKGIKVAAYAHYIINTFNRGKL